MSDNILSRLGDAGKRKKRRLLKDQVEKARSEQEKAYDVMMNLIKQDSPILADPAPVIAVFELASSSANFVVRPWLKKEDYWSVKSDFSSIFIH